MIKAILLAAGQSKRLKSENKLIKLYKKKPLINHSLNALYKSKVYKVIVVLGHQKKDLQKIILCDIQNDIYPNLEKILLNLLSDSGFSNVKFDKKVDFNKLFNDKFN